MLTGFAYLNENLIKKTLKVARPSHTYLITHSGSLVKLDSVYSMATKGRRTFFKDLIDHDTIDFKDIDPRILNHWIDEAGYSFPSGHSFNAFLLASFLAFAAYKFEKDRITAWSVLPMLWATMAAFSRVFVGAHTPLDVSVGAALGIVISHVLLVTPFTQRLLLPQTPAFVGTDQK